MANQVTSAYRHRINASQPGYPAGVTVLRHGFAKLTTALAVNEYLQLVPVFKGERLLWGRLFILDELDEGAGNALRFTIGDSGDPDRYLTPANALGTTGGVIEFPSVGATAARALALRHTYTDDDDIRMVVTAAAADWRDAADAPAGAQLGRIAVEALFLKSA